MNLAPTAEQCTARAPESLVKSTVSIEGGVQTSFLDPDRSATQRRQHGMHQPSVSRNRIALLIERYAKQSEGDETVEYIRGMKAAARLVKVAPARVSPATSSSTWLLLIRAH